MRVGEGGLSGHSCDSRSQRTIPGSNDQMPAAIKPVGRAFPGYGGANPGAMRPLPARWCNCRFRHGRAFPGCASSVGLPRSCVSRLRVSQLRDPRMLDAWRVAVRRHVQDMIGQCFRDRF